MVSISTRHGAEIRSANTKEGHEVSGRTSSSHFRKNNISRRRVCVVKYAHSLDAMNEQEPNKRRRKAESSSSIRKEDDVHG